MKEKITNANTWINSPISSSKNMISEKLKEFFVFLVDLRNNGVIDEEEFQTLKKSLKNPDTLEYLTAETIILLFGNIYWILVGSLPSYILLQGEIIKAGLIAGFLQSIRGLLYYLSLLYSTKNLKDKKELATMSMIPILGEFYPLIKLGTKKGTALPGYFHFYLKNKKIYTKYKSENTQEQLLQILGGGKIKSRKKENNTKKIP